MAKLSIQRTAISLCLLASALTAPPGQAQLIETGSGRILISVADGAYAEARCTDLHQALKLEFRSDELESVCLDSANDPEAPRKLDEARGSGAFTYHFRYRAKSAGASERLLSVDNWSRRDDADFEQVTWELAPPRSDDELRLTLRQLMRRFAEYDRSRDAFREYVLRVGAQTSGRLAVDEKGRFRDRRLNRPVDFEQAYAIFREEKPKHRHFLRAAFEIAAALGVGGMAYYALPSLQDNDYDVGGALRARFSRLDVHRFDDNRWAINHLGHPLGGSLYYGFARSNGFDPMESFLWSLAASSTWEVLIELREKVSINDHYFTAVAGTVIGEVFHQIHGVFARGRDNWANRVLRTIFGGPEEVNRWIARTRPTPSRDIDEMGFANDVWKKLSVAVERDSYDATALQLGATVIDLPGYGQAGKTMELVGSTPLSRMLLEGRMGPRDQQEVLMYFQTALVGWYLKSLEKKGRDLEGYEFFVGPGLAFRNETIDTPQVIDRIAVLNVLGPTMMLTAYHKGWRLQATVDVYGDLAAIRPFALDEYAKENSLDGAKSVLRKQGYYFGYGGTFDSKVAVSWRDVEVGGRVHRHRVDSIEGLSRFQDQVTDDFPLSDTRGLEQAWIAFEPMKRARFTLGVEKRHFRGEIRDVVTSNWRARTYGMLTLWF